MKGGDIMISESREHKGEVWGVKELADFLRISTITLYRSLENGDIPCRKIGSQYRFYRPAVEEWLSFPLKMHELDLYFHARHARAKEYGLDKMSMEEIDREVEAVRKTRRKRKRSK